MHGLKSFQVRMQAVELECFTSLRLKLSCQEEAFITKKCDCLVVRCLNIYEVYSSHVAFP